LIFLFVLYGIWMFIQVKAGAKDLALPVLIYILVILAMGITAFNREGAVSKKSFRLVGTGAILFMLSDSLLAWNKFVEPIELAPVFVLSTYGIAQLMIVSGMLAQAED